MAVPRAMLERCKRLLADQVADSTGALRRVDHPRDSVHRLDLLDDAQLDAFRVRHRERAERALDAHHMLLEAVELRVAAIEEAARVALEDRIAERPILTVFVCLECGASDVAGAKRRWDVDRALRRTTLPERDLLAVAMLLAEAWAEVAGPPPPLDEFAATQIAELRALVGEDVDLASVRTTYGPANR